MRLCATMMLVALSACSADYYRLRAEQRRHDIEYDWEKPGAFAVGNHVLVHPPKWADPSDWAKVREAVDATVDALRGLFPEARDFDFGRVVVWIHEAVGRYVSPQAHWITGQRIGNKITVSFVKVGERYVLWSLPHELLHVLFDPVDAGNIHSWETPEVKEKVASARKGVEFDAGSRAAAGAFVYEPWKTPK